MIEESYLDRVYRDLRDAYGRVYMHGFDNAALAELLYGMLGRMEIIEKRLEQLYIFFEGSK